MAERRKTYRRGYRKTNGGYGNTNYRRRQMPMYRGLRNFQPNAIIRKKVSAITAVGPIGPNASARNYGTSSILFGSSIIPDGQTYVLFSDIMTNNPDFLRIAQSYSNFRVTGAKVIVSSMSNATARVLDQTTYNVFFPCLHIVVRLDQGTATSDLTPNEVVNTDSSLVCPAVFQGMRKKYWRFPKTLSGPGGNTVGWYNTLDGYSDVKGSFEMSAYTSFPTDATAYPRCLFEVKYVLYCEFWTENGGQAL